MKEIEIYLTGRLGNQLFQYSMAKSIQKKYGGDIICNIYDLEHVSGKLKHIDKKFNYDLNNYALNNEVKIIDKKLPWYADLSNIIIKFVKKLIPKLYFKIMVRLGYLIWQRDEYIEIPELKTERITIYGWWQDFRFFNDASDEIKNSIVPTSEPNINNKYIYDLSKENESVCISIRGGNYLYPTVKKKLFVCDRNYFYDSIDKISSLIEQPKFVIFSDDLKWVKDYIRFEEKYPNYEFIYERGDDTVDEKIRMMSSFKNFIISNSSFSWWAQYLSKKNNKIVIAPDKWFTNGKKNGLYMDNWILVNTKGDDN